MRTGAPPGAGAWSYALGAAAWLGKLAVAGTLLALFETAIGYVGYHVAGYLADGIIEATLGDYVPETKNCLAQIEALKL